MPVSGASFRYQNGVGPFLLLPYAEGLEPHFLPTVGNNVYRDGGRTF